MRAGRVAIWLGLACFAVAAFQNVAQACPMCAETIAGQDALPRAYMYSILFMMSMPAIVFLGICVCIYRSASKRPQIAPQAALPAGAENPDQDSVTRVPELAGQV